MRRLLAALGFMVFGVIAPGIIAPVSPLSRRNSSSRHCMARKVLFSHPPLRPAGEASMWAARSAIRLPARISPTR